MRVLEEPTSRAVSLMTVRGKGYAVGGALHLHLFDSLVYPSWCPCLKSYRFLDLTGSLHFFFFFFVPGSEKNGFPDAGASFACQLGELNNFFYYICFMLACDFMFYAWMHFNHISFHVYLDINCINLYKIKLDNKSVIGSSRHLNNVLSKYIRLYCELIWKVWKEAETKVSIEAYLSSYKLLEPPFYPTLLTSISLRPKNLWRFARNVYFSSKNYSTQKNSILFSFHPQFQKIR